MVRVKYHDSKATPYGKLIPASITRTSFCRSQMLHIFIMFRVCVSFGSFFISGILSLAARALSHIHTAHSSFSFLLFIFDIWSYPFIIIFYTTCFINCIASVGEHKARVTSTRRGRKTRKKEQRKNMMNHLQHLSGMLRRIFILIVVFHLCDSCRRHHKGCESLSVLSTRLSQMPIELPVRSSQKIRQNDMHNENIRLCGSRKMRIWINGIWLLIVNHFGFAWILKRPLHRSLALWYVTRKLQSIKGHRCVMHTKNYTLRVHMDSNMGDIKDTNCEWRYTVNDIKPGIHFFPVIFSVAWHMHTTYTDK